MNGPERTLLIRAAVVAGATVVGLLFLTRAYVYALIDGGRR